MTQAEIDGAIYKKYIEPTKAYRKPCSGIEIEMPVVNLSGKPVEKQVCLEVTSEFRKRFGFEENGRDDEGNIYSMIQKETGDDLSFDCAYSNLELSLGKGDNLYEVKERFETYYRFLNQEFSKYQYILTGMGIHPQYNTNYNKPILNERYRMLYHHLHTYEKYPGHFFTNRADFGTFTSASQVQIDVEYDKLVQTINVFGMVEPYKALLFANSYMQEYPEYRMVRNMLWENSMQGYNKHNIGMFEQELQSVEELVEYIKSTSIYCAMREGKYVNFTPVPIGEYLQLEQVKGEFFDGEEYQEIVIEPDVSDLDHLRSFKFEDLTFRGTIEFRSACCQPISDSMVVAAFHIGLMSKVSELEKILREDQVLYGHGYHATELQKMMSMSEIPKFVDESKLVVQLVKILDLASEGLKERGYQEEKLLIPLYERAKKLTNPAKEMVKGIQNGRTIRDYILKYASV